MSGCHWSDNYVEWLRHICPELDGDQLYLRQTSELPADFSLPGTIAYTSFYLDLQMQSALTSRGAWAGRGYAIVADSDAFWREDDQTRCGTLVHELGHCIEDGRRKFIERDDMSLREAMLTIPGGREYLAQTYNIDRTSDDVLSRQRVRHHGAQFVRAALHLWQRAGSLHIDDCLLFSPGYASPDVKATIAALSDELRAGGDLFDVLTSPIPAAFAQLFEGPERLLSRAGNGVCGSLKTAADSPSKRGKTGRKTVDKNG